MAKKNAKAVKPLLVAAPGVTINSIAGDTNDPATVDTPSPWAVVVTVTLSSGATLDSIAYQIDDGPLVPFSTAGSPLGFNLTEDDLPDLTSYLLSVYAWATSGGFSRPSVGIAQKGILRAS